MAEEAEDRRAASEDLVVAVMAEVAMEMEVVVTAEGLLEAAVRAAAALAAVELVVVGWEEVAWVAEGRVMEAREVAETAAEGGA